MSYPGYKGIFTDSPTGLHDTHTVIHRHGVTSQSLPGKITFPHVFSKQSAEETTRSLMLTWNDTQEEVSVMRPYDRFGECS